MGTSNTHCTSINPRPRSVTLINTWWLQIQHAEEGQLCKTQVPGGKQRLKNRFFICHLRVSKCLAHPSGWRIKGYFKHCFLKDNHLCYQKRMVGSSPQTCWAGGSWSFLTPHSQIRVFRMKLVVYTSWTALYLVKWPDSQNRERSFL